MKKIIALFAAVLIAVTAFTGCKAPETGDLTEFKNRPNEVVFYYAYDAYGKEWITEIARKYMTDHNEDTYINLKKSLDGGSDLAKVESGVNCGDLYILGLHMEDGIAYYEDLSDVYNSYPIGEEGQKKIIEKVSQYSYEYYENSGAQNYIMPKGGSGAGTNYAYNKTVLDEIFPDGYTLPRTTNEFIEMGDAIKNSNTGYYLLTGAFGDTDSGDYVNYMHKTWFAQLIGYEAYEQFLMGRYYDSATQKWTFDESAPTVYSKYKNEIKAYYQTMEDIYSKSNGYLQPDSGVVNQSEGQVILSGIPFGDYKMGVFMAQGGFVEQEMDWMLAEQESAGVPQELGMMKIPVASAIIERTPSIDNEAELREVIDYVDNILLGESATKPAGVTDDDIEIILEARSMSGSYMAGGMIVPKYANNKQGAKDFIRYLASDEAALIAAKCNNGVNTLPFGTEITEEQLGFERSNFINQFLEISKKTRHIISSDSQEYLFTYIADFDPIPNVRTIIKNLCNGLKLDEYSADTVFDDALKTYRSEWTNDVLAYKQQGGSTSND